MSYGYRRAGRRVQRLNARRKATVIAPNCAVWPLDEPLNRAGARANGALRWALELPHALSYL